MIDGHLRRAIKRFEEAAVEKAFEGSIPYDCEAAIAAHEEIDREYKRSRELLEKMIERRMA